MDEVIFEEFKGTGNSELMGKLLIKEFILPWISLGLVLEEELF